MSKLELFYPPGGSQGVDIVGKSGKFGDIANGNYCEFQDNGFFQCYGDARPWIDFNFDGASLALGAAAPDLIQWNGSRIRVRAFDGGNTTEELSKVIELNHNWAEGTIIRLHVHWSPVNGNAGNVEWFLDWFAIDGSDYTGIATLSVLQAAGGSAWTEQFADIGQIQLTDTYKLGTQMGFCLYRIPGATNPDDTYASDAALLTIGLHVQLSSMGSCQVSVKEC